MGFNRTFNSTTMYGRRNVAVATLGSIASFVMYKKLSGSPKVKLPVLFVIVIVIRNPRYPSIYIYKIDKHQHCMPAYIR